MARKSGARRGPGAKVYRFNGKSQTLREWADELNMSLATIYSRISTQGWSVDRALSTPVRVYKHRAAPAPVALAA